MPDAAAKRYRTFQQAYASLPSTPGYHSLVKVMPGRHLGVDAASTSSPLNIPEYDPAKTVAWVAASGASRISWTEGAVVINPYWLIHGDHLFRSLVFESNVSHGHEHRIVTRRSSTKAGASIRFLNCLFRNLQSNTTENNHGGAITNQGADLRLEHCTLFRCNSVSYEVLSTPDGPLNVTRGLASIVNAVDGGTGILGRISLSGCVIWDDWFPAGLPVALPDEADHQPLSGYTLQNPVTGPEVYCTSSLIQGGMQGSRPDNPMLNSKGYLTAQSTACLHSTRNSSLLQDLQGQARSRTPTLGAVEWLNQDTDTETDSLPDWWEMWWFGHLQTRDPDITDPGLSVFFPPLPTPRPPTALEHYLAFSKPLASLDGDHLRDDWEMMHFHNLDQTDADNPDGDSRDNLQEQKDGTDPTQADDNPDSDADGLPDAWERQYFTLAPQPPEPTPDPLRFDADDDPDGDGFNNQQELTLGTVPNSSDAATDVDNDGLPDTWERLYFKTQADIVAQTGTTDFDMDGLNNLEEFRAGSNPIEPDIVYLHVRRGDDQTATIGQSLPDPIVVQAVREEFDEGGQPIGFTAMASKVVTFSGPEGMTFTTDSREPLAGSNPLSVMTDETGYARVSVQAPSQAGTHAILASLGSSEFSTSIRFKVEPTQPPGPGPGPGGGPGSAQSNPDFTLQWQYVWRSALVDGSETIGGFSYHRSQQQASAPGVQPTRVGTEATTPLPTSPSGHYGHPSANPSKDDPGLANTLHFLYDPSWKEFSSTDFGTSFAQDWHMSPPPLNAESVLIIPFESFSQMLHGNAHDDRAFGLSKSMPGPLVEWQDENGRAQKGRWCSASVEQHRARIAAIQGGQPITLPQGTQLTLIAMETTTPTDVATGTQGKSETRLIKTVQLVIPPGQSVSAPIQTEDFMSPAGPGTEKILRLLPIDLAIDANRDGIIANGETASREKPLRFWINNDSDTGEIDKEEEGTTPDHQDGALTNIRDLEDFQLLKVSLPKEIFTKHQNSEVQIGLKWKNISGGTPAVNVYRVSPEIDEPKDYLWNVSKASSQTPSNYHTSIAFISGGATAWLPANAFQNLNGDQHPYLLFEGASKGIGQLCLVFKAGGNSSEAEGPGIWLKLMDVEEMFASAQGKPDMPYPNPPDHLDQEPPRPATDYKNISWTDRGEFEKDPDETNEAIIMVHGWNMTDPDRRTFSESFFKRLWWKGYKGRFATFAWPTYNSDDDALGFIPDHYNRSEYVAWKYGPALKAYVDSINKASKHVAAHSMGNVVMASALKYGLNVGSYVAMQAAIPAGCYDSSPGANSYLKFLQAEQVRATPDLASALGYRGVTAGISGNFFNFQSANDYALKTGAVLGANVSWEGNQISYKPNEGLRYEYYPNAVGAAKNRIELQTFDDSGAAYIHEGRDVTDHHEVMSFIARPRSPALGTLDTNGFTNFNLKTMVRYPFGTDRTEHSGQYQRPIQKTHMFFNTLLDSMDVEFNYLDDTKL